MLRSDINGAVAAVPAIGTVCSRGDFSDRTYGLVCLHELISSSSGESGRCLADLAERLLRRWQRKSRAKRAASARAPSVQPRTIGSVSTPPPPEVLAELDCDAAATEVGADVRDGVMVGVGVIEALVTEVVLLDEVEEVEEVEVLLLEVDVALVDVVVEAVVGANIEVTAVYMDCASDSKELKKSACADETVTRHNTGTSLWNFMATVSFYQLKVNQSVLTFNNTAIIV